jgi:hypothetical protein
MTVSRHPRPTQRRTLPASFFNRRGPRSPRMWLGEAVGAHKNKPNSTCHLLAPPRRRAKLPLLPSRSASRKGLPPARQTTFSGVPEALAALVLVPRPETRHRRATISRSASSTKPSDECD